MESARDFYWKSLGSLKDRLEKDHSQLEDLLRHMAYEVHRILSPLCSRTEVEAKYDWTFTRIYAGEYVTGLGETFLAPGLSQGASCHGC